MYDPRPRMAAGRESGSFVRSAADLCTLAAILLWAVIQWAIVSPPWSWPLTGSTWAAAIGESAFAILLALCCAVVTPAIWAAIFPNTAAAQLLQEVRRSAWGFYVLSLCAGVLTVYSWYMVRLWWYAQLPNPADWLTAELQAAITMIFFIPIPAWAFNHTSPVAWVAEVQQAHAVKKLRLQLATELDMIKAEHASALHILRAGLANATMAEREQVAGTLIGMQRAQNEQIRQIAGSIRDIYGMERAAPGALTDDRILSSYGRLVELLEAQHADVIEVEVLPEPPAWASARPAERPVDRPAERPDTSRERPVDRPAVRGGTAADREAGGGRREAGDALAAARRALGAGAWTRAGLEAALSVRRTTASDYITRWRESGNVIALVEPAHHYRFVAEEVDHADR